MSREFVLNCPLTLVTICFTSVNSIPLIRYDIFFGSVNQHVCFKTVPTYTSITYCILMFIANQFIILKYHLIILLFRCPFNP